CATEHAGRARELLRGTSGSRRPGSVPAEPFARPEEDAPAADQNPYAPPRASAPPRAAEPTAESAPRPAAAPEEGAARPSQFGSRPEEPPRYGIRVPPEEGQGRDQTRDGDQS
ncbi:hypothetical protein PU560_11915, partial [Georgenia sp. 10Sc9-8]|nr:hypothetical protein [Georgenia halotolerans]